RQGHRGGRRRGPARSAPSLRGRARARRPCHRPAVRGDRRRPRPGVARRGRGGGQTRGFRACPQRGAGGSGLDQPRIAHRPGRSPGRGPQGFTALFQAFGPPSGHPPLRPRDVVHGGGGGGVMAARKPAAVPAGRHLLREAEALTGGAVAVFVALSLISYAPDLPRQNLGGPVGHLLADTALRALGIAAYLFPIYLGFVAIALLRRNAEDWGGMRLGGAVLLVSAVAALAG